jgi:hypothetical protein
MNLEPLPTTFPATVAALHRVAEQIAATAGDDVALGATPGGFGTRALRVDGAELVREIDGEERREPLDVDPDAAARLADWYAFGAAMLGAIADATASPIRLWPEHFDIAIEMGPEPARANYGFSPGDEQHGEPYAYVGPWTAEVEGELWRATGFRGAELGYAELAAASDPRAAALAFFTSRKEALA